MKDILIGLEPSSGATVIQLNGISIAQNRFRLFNPASSKYLTRRGWSKAPSFLPDEASVDGDTVTIVLDVELARRISAGAHLVLEEPSSYLREPISWVVTPPLSIAEPPLAAERAEAEPSITTAAGLELPVADMLPAFETTKPRFLMPIALCASMVLVLGIISAYLWLNSVQDAPFQPAAQAASDVRDKNKTALEKKSSGLQDHATQLTATAPLPDHAQFEALTAKAGKPPGPESEIVTALRQEIEAARQDIIKRDGMLRDFEAKLSVAEVQIEALKNIASKTTGETMEKAELTEKINALNGHLTGNEKQLAEKVAALADLNGKLGDASTRIASLEAEKQQRQAQPAAGDQSAEIAAGLQKERDLYAQELAKITDNFIALKKEKEAIEQALTDLRNQPVGEGSQFASTPLKSIWGATAIDENGIVYALQNQTTEKAAQDNVIAICRGKSKFACEPLASYDSKCFSLARFKGEDPSSDNFAYFVHQDWKKSASVALARCEKDGAQCSTRFTVCSPDTLSKPNIANQ